MTFNGHNRVAKHDGGSSESWHPYRCSFCGTRVSGAVVASTSWPTQDRYQPTRTVQWLQCTNCGGGSVANDDRVGPAVPFGPVIEGLPDDVKSAYIEARRCLGVNSYTAAELICRKILMHVAVEKGANAGESFASYVTYLEKQGRRKLMKHHVVNTPRAQKALY